MFVSKKEKDKFRLRYNFLSFNSNIWKGIWRVILLAFAILILPAVGVAYCFW